MAQLLKVLLVTLVTEVIFTSGMKCNKFIFDKATFSDMEMPDDVMEMGRYMVETIDRVNSSVVLRLLSKVRDIKMIGRSFTAILQPSDLKKVWTIKHVKLHVCS